MALQGVPAISSASTLTLTPSASIYVYNGAGTATWTLPAITGNSGEILVLYNRGNGTVTVQRAGSDQIDNYGSLVNSIPLPPNTSMELLNDGTYWLSMNSSWQMPTYDNSAIGADKTITGLSSGTAYTWTHTVATGNPYGLVAIFSSDGTIDPTTITSAVVTFGGVTLSQIGYVSSTQGGTDRGWIWLFGAPNIPAGTNQTVSTTLTQAGQTFHHFGASYTYRNVAALGAFLARMGGNNYQEWMSVTLPRSSPNPARVWYAAEAHSATPIGVTSGAQRQYFDNNTTGLSMGYSADTSAFGAEAVPCITTVNSSSAVSFWGACALEMFGQKPTGPYLNAVGSTQLNAGGTFTNNTFYHLAAAGTDVFVAIQYLKNTGTSLGAVTYGGAAMTQIASVYCNNDTTGASGELFLYHLANVSGGLKQISLTYTGGAPQSVWADSASYYGVNTVGTATTATGSGTSLSQTVSCTTGQLILQLFGSKDQNITETDGASNLFNGSSGLLAGSLQINQAVATNTFTGTQSGSTPWAGIAVVLS